MNDILFQIIKATVIIAVMVCVRYFIPWAKTIINNSQYEWVANLVKGGVEAAEQTTSTEKAGIEKKAIVTKFIKEQLTAKNISISDDQLNTLIESAVYALNQAKKV